MMNTATLAEIEKVIGYLVDIDHARRGNDDEKLKRLSRDADDMARRLKSVKAEVHRHLMMAGLAFRQ
jgi:hypothetical protein